jgi:hypothetical protein
MKAREGRYIHHGCGYLPLNMVEAFKKHIDTGEKRFVEGGTHTRCGYIFVKPHF